MENGNVGKILLTSYLQKRSKLLHRWRNRFCVLTEKYLLTYKSADKNTESSNSITLAECISVGDADKTLDKKFCFELANRDRIFYFQAKNQESKEEWIDTLRKILEMNKLSKSNSPTIKIDDSIEVIDQNQNQNESEDSNSSA